MNDFLEELGGMELSPEETREVLRRMAVEEFGGSERTRVRDISELTGASSEAIGRMVADMRGESWGAWKASIESRLQALETHANRIEPKQWDLRVPQRTVAPISQKESNENWTIPLFTLGGIAFIGVCLFSYFNGHSAGDWESQMTAGGYQFGFNGECRWSEADSTGKPGPVMHHKESKEAETTLFLMKSSRCFEPFTPPSNERFP